MGPAIARTFQGDFVNRHRTSIVVTIKFLLLTLAYAPAQAAEPFACLDLARAFDPQADLSSLQLNSQLFRAADLGCARLARTLLDAGSSVEARDRFGAMPLAHAARAGHVGRHRDRPNFLSGGDRQS